MPLKTSMQTRCKSVLGWRHLVIAQSSLHCNICTIRYPHHSFKSINAHVSLHYIDQTLQQARPSEAVLVPALA